MEPSKPSIVSGEFPTSVYPSLSSLSRADWSSSDSVFPPYLTVKETPCTSSMREALSHSSGVVPSGADVVAACVVPAVVPVGVPVIGLVVGAAGVDVVGTEDVDVVAPVVDPGGVAVVASAVVTGGVTVAPVVGCAFVVPAIVVVVPAVVVTSVIDRIKYTFKNQIFLHVKKFS